MGSSGKLVTATDIPDGLIMNADINAVAQIALGKLFTMPANNVMRSTGTTNFAGPLTNAEIGAQQIRGGVDGAAGRIVPNSLVNSDLAAQTIRGGVDAGNGRIVPNSLTNSDLAVQTIRGGLDVASSRIAPATINEQDLALRSTVQLVGGAVASGTGGGAAPWAYAGCYADIVASPTSVCVLAFFIGSVSNSVINQAIYMGIGAPDVTSAPQVQVQFAAGVLTSTPFLLMAIYPGMTGSHRIHAIYGVQGGGQQATFSNIHIDLLELKR